MSDFDKDNDFENFEDAGFDDFNSGGGLKDLWQNNPLLKLFVVIVGVLIVGYFALSFVSKPDPIESRISNAPNENETLGGNVSASYADAIDEVNDQRLEEALQTQGSTIPMTVNMEDPVLLSETEEVPPYEEFDPLASFREAIKKEPEPVEEETTPDAPFMNEEPVLVAPATPQYSPYNEQPFDAGPQAPVITPEAIQAMSQAMSQQIGEIISNHAIRSAQIMQVTNDGFYGTGPASPDGYYSPVSEYGSAPGSLSAPQPIIQTILLPAGTINYGQMLIEANSDIPGPVLAQLASGPLAGARLIGQFQTAEEALIISFNTIVIDGISQPVSAIAIDPGTTLPGVATEVDKRYFTRVLLPAAARFLEGVGSAIAEDTQTTVTVSGDTVIQEQEALDFEQEMGRGVEAASREIADFMEDEADATRPLVRVARGTPIGVFFIEPVVEGE